MSENLEAESTEGKSQDVTPSVQDTAGDTAVPDPQPKRLPLATRLQHVAQQAELFRTPDREPYAAVPVGSHFEVYPLGSQQFSSWLQERMFRLEGDVVPASAMEQTIDLLVAKALFSGVERTVHLRVAGHEGDIVVDLGDPSWRVVRVSPGKPFQVLDRSPVMFRRPKGFLELPIPERDGTVELLRPFLNVRDDAQWKLIIGWTLAALWPHGPYPLLELTGDQGSAKSTTAKILKALVDPNIAPARSFSTERDLAIAAKNSWVPVFDNLSRIPKVMSDALCRMSTGGAFSTRKLYSDDEEMLFEAKRPIILNGIGEVVVESDLLDRTIALELPTLEPGARKDENTFWNEFEQAKGKILGALLDTVSAALSGLAVVPERDDWPRMADFAKWVSAAEAHLGWEPGAFMDVYIQNRMEANLKAIDDDAVALFVMGLAESGGWAGTATELLAVSRDCPRFAQSFPSGANRLSQRLRELKPNLAGFGVEITFKRVGRLSIRTIEIRKAVVGSVGIVRAAA